MILTIDMINIIGTHVFVISFLPSKWKFISNTVCKCLRFCKSAIKTKKNFNLHLKVDFFQLNINIKTFNVKSHHY